MKNLILKLNNFLFSCDCSNIVLTASRAAWLGLLLSVPIFFGRRGTKLFIAVISAIFLILLLIFVPIFGEGVQNLIMDLLPQGIWSNFLPSTYEMNISRIEIWKIALDTIFKNPIFGSGSSFKMLEAKTGFWRGHTHNLPLEIMVIMEFLLHYLFNSHY